MSEVKLSRGEDMSKVHLSVEVFFVYNAFNVATTFLYHSYCFVLLYKRKDQQQRL